jgi:signal transduction histidine kinase
MVHATSEIDRLAEGEHISTPPPTVVHGEGEIASLARSFDVLVQRLNAAYDEILALHRRSMHKADQLATVGEMAAGMAHEIKNPVTGIHAALQVILREESPDSEHYDIFREMLVQLDRIDGAVNDLLCFSREDPPDIREINIKTILEKTVLLVQPMLRELPVTIDLRCDSENDVIEADGKQLQQVVWNLIMNAMQAIPDRGTITIRTQLSGNLMDIIIHDSGVGIPKDLQSIVFKPFYTSKHKGTGLGLTICSRIVQQHGGSILIDSSPGEGTTVRVRIPVRQPRRSAHAR